MLAGTGMLPLFDNRYLYMGVNAWYAATAYPSRCFKFTADMLHEHALSAPEKDAMLPFFERGAVAQLRLMQRLMHSYEKPAFGIFSTALHGKTVAVEEEIVLQTPFCRLLHFRKEHAAQQPRLLMVAPMAGHHATLLRDTVRDALPYYDVYITDWTNARDVPISQGGFDMDSYIATLVRCFEVLAPDFHVMGICQSGVPVYAAVALLEGHKELRELCPKSMILMGSPIDVRHSPTSVNVFANEHGEDWLERFSLSIVPDGYAGAQRLVYPGFMQLLAFISMNPERHQKSISDAMRHYIEGDFDREEKINSFYAEYCSVMDLTAEFYLQTVRVVFQEALLPQGKFVSRGRPIDPRAIRRTAILAIEGEHDDICGVGQTKAALELATNLPSAHKSYLLLKEAGHYGLFNGHRFRETVLPAMRHFTAPEKPARLQAA